MNARATPAEDGELGVANKLSNLDWEVLGEQLSSSGYALVEALLGTAECKQLAGSYGEDELFRNRIVMERHAYGRGEYKYFAYPLPPLIQDLREALYAPLAVIANRWQAQLNRPMRYPAEHRSFLEQCHAAGQQRPTPLLLKYGPGDFNRLHQDKYGEHLFPLQVTVLLSDPMRDFSGGEFVLTESRPRRQSRAQVVPLRQGDAVLFAVDQRPVPSQRGVSRCTQRHGVSTLRSGHRYTLGIIFHDAK